MKKSIRMFYIFLLMNFLMTPVGLWAKESKAPPVIYEEEPQDEEEHEDWVEESLDEYGQPVIESKYRDEWEEQGKDIQDQAALPFGKAKHEFGSEKLTAKKLKKIDFAEKKEDPEFVEDTVLDGSSDAEVAPPQKKAPAPSAEKPRVLVS